VTDMIEVNSDSINICHLAGDCLLWTENLLVPREKFDELTTVLHNGGVEKAILIIKKLNTKAKRPFVGEVFAVLRKALQNGSVERPITISNEMNKQKSEDTRFIIV
jgi:hypothetical protein